MDPEEIAENETRRLALQSNIAFQNLGEPVQKLLFALNSEVSDADLTLLSKITVKQLAKVFDMMSSGEDPEKILAWLRRTAKRNAEGEDPYQNERKKKIHTGASHDPISFYKEIERRNFELQERHKKRAEDREKQRQANIARREEERQKRMAQAAEEKRLAEQNGENTTALDRLKDKDRSDLTNTFERFVNKQSTYDNSTKAQDGEWWKKEEFRRDYEKLGKKGKKWKAVQEGGSLAAPDAELATREDWFKSQTWWKGDKYRNDWMKTRDVAWWKETPYIKDWQENSAKGTMWTAADETSGFNRKGREHSADMAELNLRIDWYKVNGPKGIQKIWNALSEGAVDKCTVEEKQEREDYYKNGDWWRTEETYRRYNQPDAGYEALKIPGPTGGDREWWKNDKYRLDHQNKGDLWKCANEVAISQGKAKECPATSSEQERRSAWYKANWWTERKFLDDFQKNGAKGLLWRSRSEEDSRLASPKLCKDSEAIQRQQWFESADHILWWKDNEYLRDYENHGDKGEKWSALCEEMGAAGRASEFPAAEPEKKRREDWYKQNWWKAERCAKDYLQNKNGTTWCAAQPYVTRDKDWWKQPKYREEYKKLNSNPGIVGEYWQTAEAVDDYHKHGLQGKIWNANNALNASVHKGDAHPATADELAKRKAWMAANWWRGGKYQAEWAAKGMKGSLWLSAEEPSHHARGGTVAAPEELKHRQEFYKAVGSGWKAITETEAVKDTKFPCHPRTAIDRANWYKQFWWKTPEMLKDYLAKGDTWKAATEVAANEKKGGHAEYQAVPEELKEREKWFRTCSDLEFWQDPSYVEDYLKKGKEGALWTARNAIESQRAMGKERPAEPAALKEREDWYNKNWWKSPECIQDFAKNGTKWQATKSGASDKTSPAEIEERKYWLQAHAPCTDSERGQREHYLKNQLTDLEVGHRFTWLDNKTKDDKRINREELPDLLQMLNQNVPPTADQVKSVLDKIEEFRAKGLAQKSADGSMSQEEIIHAVAETGFYVPPTDQELQMNEEEVLEELEKEEAARMEEEAAFLAMEAEEERRNARVKPADVADEDEEDAEEAAFLAEQEAKKVPKVNEDDVLTDEQQKAWKDFEKNPAEKEKHLKEEEEAEKKKQKAREAEAARKKAEDEAWKQEAEADDAPEEEGAQIAELDPQAKEDLEAEVAADENKQWQEQTEEEEEEEEEEEVKAAEVKKPAEPKPEAPKEKKNEVEQWKLPLPKVTNPQFLKAYFMVIKYIPKGALVSGKQKRVWVVDHFTRSFYNMDTDGTIRKEHAAHKLLQLEKSTVDSKRVRMMFLDASHSYELLFPNANERERFYESASAIRPSIRVYAPSLTNPDGGAESSSTTIDGVGQNTVVVQVPTLKGSIVDRELTGECKINASRSITENISVWVGTLNLSGSPPAKDTESLEKWMPKGKYDIYAVGIQEGSYQREENEWFSYIQKHLGKEYLTLATMRLWDIYLIVLARKKNLLRIANVEGSTKATSHKSVCGTKGGVGICLRVHDTSLCFVTCQLAARQERTAMRNTNVQEIIDSLQLSLADVEFTQQFHHVFFFGDFNYRVEMKEEDALRHIAAKEYGAVVEHCQLNQQCRTEGLLHGFMEPPVSFRPTYRLKKGTLEYNSEKGTAPSYTDRILIKSIPNASISCTSYNACEKLLIGEHLPVSATFSIRAIRPCISCFEKVQKPRIRLVFHSVTVSENTGPASSKAQLTLYTNFSDGPYASKNFATGDELHLSWGANDIPTIDSVSHLAEYVELQHVLLVIRDTAEKNSVKAARGSSCLPLTGAIANKQGVKQDFALDMRVHGKKVGTMKVTMSWVPQS